MDTISNCVYDFTRYFTYSHIFYGGRDDYTKEEEEMLKEQIKDCIQTF